MRAAGGFRYLGSLHMVPIVHKLLILLHLVGFAAYVGAGFAQQQFISRSRGAGLAAAVRDEYERLAAGILTRIELPAIFAQVATGVVFVGLVAYGTG